MEERNNQSYWVIIDGLRRGPMTIDELVRLAPGPATPVWRQGLQDWCALSSLPELHGCSPTPPPPAPPTPPVYPAYPSEPYLRPQTPSAPQPSPYSQWSVNPQPPMQPTDPMPPTYLAWSIVVMLLCCLVPGIVALVYSTKVSSRYSNGDYAGAKSASESAALWIIVTVVCGIIAVPFQILLALI